MAAAVGAVLLVDRLAGDAEPLGDRLPRPALLASVRNVQHLEFVDEDTKCCDGSQADVGIAAVDGVGQDGELLHGCQPRLTVRVCQPGLTARRSAVRSGDELGRGLGSVTAQPVDELGGIGLDRDVEWREAIPADPVEVGAMVEQVLGGVDPASVGRRPVVG
jgi:hypothetical protein